MAASGKFDLTSGNPDGPTYSNGSRGSFSVVSLERLGSFHKATENQIISSFPSMARGGPSLSHRDVVNLLQSLPLDPRQMAADQKFPRSGEIKRMIASALCISQDDSSISTVNMKSIPSSVEEIRRVKSIVHDNCDKASSRAKIFGEALSTVDKFCHGGGISKKRSRSDVLSSDRPNVLGPGDRPIPVGSTTKMGSQSHIAAGGVEVGPQKSEDRTKSGAPKRIRTSMVDMDVRANGLARQSGPADRDRDIFRFVNGSGAVQSEEKGRALQPGVVDGWEKSKMRKKRSGIKSDIPTTSAILSKPPLDGEHDTKRRIQQRISNDARSRLSTTQGFRSGPVGVGKVDTTSQQSGIGIRSAPRNVKDSGSVSNDRRDRLASVDKERITLKAVNKPNACEENSAGSPTLVTKMSGLARGPRSTSVVVPKSSPNIPRPTGISEDFENSQSTNKHHSALGPNNRKRPSSVRSSSPPVAQWVGQRPQKITRVARRTNFVPLVPTNDEAPSSDTTVASGPSTDNGLALPRRLTSNSSQVVKLKVDQVSAAGLSESEESGAAENKAKDKASRKSGEVSEKAGAAIQKGPTLAAPPRKTKVGHDEDLGDVGRQGRISRGFASIRSSLPSAMEKLDPVNAKQMRSSRLGSEKIESKVGRPLNKKSVERKTQQRPKLVVNSGSSELAGESDDDHEELLAAANAALDTSNACGSSFWKQMEPVFGFVSAQDIAFLKQQIHHAEESASSISGPCAADLNPKGDLACRVTSSTPAHVSKEISNTARNGNRMDEFERDIGAHDIIPLSLRVFAAGIDVHAIEELYCSTSQYGIGFEAETELRSKNLSQQTLDNFPTVGRGASNGHRVTATRRYLDELDHDELPNTVVISDSNMEIGPNCGSPANGLGPSDMVCTDIEYSQMCLDDRILLELQSIGLCPELLPDLSQREDDEISEDISRLEEKLHEQVVKNKHALVKIEKAVMEAREVQEREFERLALNELVGIAYGKYMTYWGPSTSGGKSLNNKIGKHAVLSLVKRVLSRCHKYEDTGRSCFSEPTFKDLFSLSSRSSKKADSTDIVAEVEPGNLLVDNSAYPSETRVPDSLGSDRSPFSITQPSHDMDVKDKYTSIGVQSGKYLPEQAYTEEDTWTNRVKRRELSLDDVDGASALRSPSGLASSISSGVKGKRSERDRDGKGQTREALSRRGATPKVGRPALGNAKGERKTKAKPKQKTTQLSASMNGLLGKASGPPKAPMPTASRTSSEILIDGYSKEINEFGLSSSCNEAEEVIDLSHLQLPGMDVLGVPDELGVQSQDIGSWLDIEDDGLLDNTNDFMGLEIPMDDLSDLNMMV